MEKSCLSQHELYSYYCRCQPEKIATVTILYYLSIIRSGRYKLLEFKKSTDRSIETMTFNTFNGDQEFIHNGRIDRDSIFGDSQKYSKLRCLLRVKGLVIGFYLGWSGHTLLIRKI